MIAQLLVLLAAAAPRRPWPSPPARCPWPAHGAGAGRVPGAGHCRHDRGGHQLGVGLVKPGYSRYVYIGVVSGAFAALVLFGMPLVPAAGGAALAYILADEFLRGKTRKAHRHRGAADLRQPLGRHAAGHQLPACGGRRGDATLLPGRPLRTWMERLLAGWSSQGEPFLANAHLEGNRISPLLGLTVYQIRRLAETGGAGFTKAFATTAEELSAILEARAVAGSKAEARGRPC